MAKGSISFVFDANDGSGPVFATYEVEEGAVARILAAHGAYYGPTPVDPDEPESAGQAMRPMTGTEIVHRWADETISRALDLVLGYEKSQAAEAAAAAVARVEVT